MNCGLDGNHLYLYASATSIRQVSLDRSVAKLKTSIERKLGRPVLCLLEPGLYQGPLHDRGRAGLSSKDGNLYIWIDPDYLNQTEITHELFHLKLRVEGVFTSEFDVKGPKDIDPFAVFQANRYFQNLLWHRLFFSRMRAMGLDPVAEQRKKLVEDLSKRFPWSPVNSAIAVYNYVQCILILDDPSFAKRYRDWLRRTGFSEEVAKGERIAKSIRRANPRTQMQMRDELAKDFTILFEENFEPSMFRPSAEFSHPSS